MTKQKPWWKQTPVAAPGAPQAVRPPPEESEGEAEDGEDEDENGDDEDGDDDPAERSERPLLHEDPAHSSSPFPAKNFT